MTDTNWCTFCDCAINPNSDFIYCSEECFKRDGLSNQSITFNEEKHQYFDNQAFITAQPLTDPMSPPHFVESRRDSCSSVSSEDLAAMYFDMLPSTPSTDLENFSPATAVYSVKHTSSTPPLLSTSISPAHSHEGTLGTPTSKHSFNLPLHEKQNPTPIISKVYLSHPNMI